LLELAEAIRKAVVFADLPPALLGTLADAARSRVVKQGEQLFRQDDDAHVFYLVTSGRLRLVQHSVEGKDVTMATFVPGDVIGLVVALMGETYPGSAEALEDGEVVSLPGTLLWPLLNEHAGLAVRVLRMVAARLHEAHNRVRELSVERVQRRIARSLLRLAQQVGVKEASGVIRLDLRLSRHDLAQMNGTTLESVSRTLTAWERSGVIEAGRERITILKPHELVTIAEDLPR
jgi:CRP-like cAMP-binding protein